MKKIYLKCLLFIISGLGIVLFLHSSASAASYCGMLASAPDGNCLDGQDYSTCTVVDGTYPSCGSGASSDQLKQQFINNMQNFDSNGRSFQQLGARFIEQFLGYKVVNGQEQDCNPKYFSNIPPNECPNWQDNINQSDVNFSIQNIGFTENYAYDPGGNQIVKFPEPGSATALIISQNGSIILEIKLNCGNPINDVGVKNIQPGWTLNGHSQQSQNGNTVTFTHLVHNNAGSANAQFDWQIQGQYYKNGNGNGWSNNNCGDNGTGQNGSNPCSLRSGSIPDSTFPNGLPPQYQNGCNINWNQGNTPCHTETFTWPANAKDGDKYCQRIYFTNASGPGTAAGWTNGACVTFTSGGVGGGGPPPNNLCETYQLPNNNPTGANGYNTSSSTTGTAPGKVPTGAYTDVTYTEYDQLNPPPGAQPVQEIQMWTINGKTFYYLNTFTQVPMPIPFDPPTGPDRLVLVWYNVYGFNGNEVEGGLSAQGIQNCYSAHCQIIPNSYANNWDQESNQQQVQVNGIWNVGVQMVNDGKDSLYGSFNHNFNYNNLSNAQNNWNAEVYPAVVTIDPSVQFSGPPYNTGVYGIYDTGSLGGSLYNPDGLGNSADLEYGIRAPNTPQWQNINFYPVYDGAYVQFGGCNATVVSYAQVSFSESSNEPSESPSSENPNTIHWGACGTNTTSPGTPYPADASEQAYLYQQSANGGPQNQLQTYNNSGAFGSDCPTKLCVSNLAQPPPGCAQNKFSFNAGDAFCVYAQISPATEWVGPNGNNTGVDPNNVILPNGVSVAPNTACSQVDNEPYVSFQGSGVLAGGCFGSCTAIEGQINTYSYTHDEGANPSPQGSGAQFGVEALCIIEGLNSANLRNPGSPVSPEGLAFSNTDTTCTPQTNAGDSIVFGGNSGLNNTSAAKWEDYYDNDKTTQANNCPSAANPVSAGTDTNGNPVNGQCWYNLNLTISGGNVPSGTNEAIFVNGNVDITGPVSYASDQGCGGSSLNPCWTTIKNIPSLYIIAKGNIYISPSVNRLDGVYIAQPNYNSSAGPPTSTQGVIDTCANSTNDVLNDNSGPSLYSNCRSQLLVNGALVAQQIYLDRTFSSLRYGAGGEYFDSTGSPQELINRCDSDPSYSGSSYGDCAAEIINYSPEMLLAQPALPPSGGPNSYQYDYITSLSPVL